MEREGGLQGAGQENRNQGDQHRKPVQKIVGQSSKLMTASVVEVFDAVDTLRYCVALPFGLTHRQDANSMALSVVSKP